MRRPATTVSRAAQRAPGISSLYEMQEFAGFTAPAQRYIARSLDVGLQRGEAAERWARTPEEAAAIAAQQRAYRGVEPVRALVPDDHDVEAAARLMAPLVALIGFDLVAGGIDGFAPCRFLYERLVGAAVRPWLPSAFCAAAVLPALHPERRRELLETMTAEVASAAGWSVREPIFVPGWVEDDDIPVEP